MDLLVNELALDTRINIEIQENSNSLFWRYPFTLVNDLLNCCLSGLICSSIRHLCHQISTIMARGVSAIDFTFNPFQTFSVRRQLIRMSFMSGRCCCCLLIVLVSLVGIYFTYYVNPALKGSAKGGTAVLNPRKDGKNAEAPSFRSEKLLSLGEGREKIMEIARLKSKLRTPFLKKEPLEVPRGNIRSGYMDRERGAVGLKKKLSDNLPGKKHFYVDLRGNIVTDEPEAEMHEAQRPQLETVKQVHLQKPQQATVEQVHAQRPQQAIVEQAKQLAPHENPQVANDQEGARKIHQLMTGKYSVEEEEVARRPITKPLVRVQGYIGKPKAKGHVFNRLNSDAHGKDRFVVQDEQPLLQDNHKDSMTGISRVVHLTWRSNKLPEIANNWVKQWHATNSILRLAFWDDASMNTFVVRLFQDFLPTWNKYKFPIDRVRAFQILVLYKLGGIYSDIDVVPLEPLKGVINMYSCILAQENPVACKFYNKRRSEKSPCVSMHTMACRPNHPFLKLVIKLLKSTALSLDCSAKPAQCTSADILGEALEEYNLVHRSNENQVQLVVPDYFSSTFDLAEKKKVQIACSDGDSLDDEQKRLCSILLEDGFESKASDSAYMLHKFLHTWGSKANSDQGVIIDGPVSVYDSVANVVNGRTLI